MKFKDKGLGEMDAEQLWETTMNPKTRTLMKVTRQSCCNRENITVFMATIQTQERIFIGEYVGGRYGRKNN